MKVSSRKSIFDHYLTLKAESTFETTVKGSRFIGFADTAADREAAQSWLRTLSSKYHNATHCCYAYRITHGNNPESRFSDGGEPAGTAGRPILGAIEKAGLFNVVCAVIRYFGGIKLGTGGLARAYSDCAEHTLAIGQVFRLYITDTLEAGYAYKDTGKVMSLINRYGCTIRQNIYRDGPVIVFEVRRSRAADLIRDLTDATSGKIHIIKGDQ